MPELKLLFLQIAAIFAAARLMTFRFIGQPGVMGEMAAGILLCPSLLGRMAPAVMERFIRAWGAASRGCRSCCFWERRWALPQSPFWRGFWGIANGCTHGWGCLPSPALRSMISLRGASSR